MNYKFKCTLAEFLENIEKYSFEFIHLHKSDIQVFVKANKVEIGIGRAGHSGGYWFVADIIESDGITFLQGDISLHSHPIFENSSWKIKLLLIFGYVIFSPIFLIRLIFLPIGKIKRKNKLNRFMNYVSQKFGTSD